MHGHGGGGGTGHGTYIPPRSNVCPSALQTVMPNATLIGNCLLHSLKGMLGSGGHKLILGVRVVFVELVTPAAMQCS